MFKIEGVCDWCKQPALLAKHDYIDGKHHHSCKDCNAMATLDVRQFNIEEQQMLAQLQKAS
ncbi:hypothetical protein QWY97_14050 [Vibrio cortegadensis]|uniref:hypothetical protein n=1 Tax=Vibrio cortegadensis TaxID=1328770 RepID=UPI0021C33243|nr:hypothetical protein [Vibrio cortegadensis]MDN3698458.1 hypothetical protein [Vibrio cortegadensis]